MPHARRTLIVLLALAAPVPGVVAQLRQQSAAPQRLGGFQDWTAATYRQDGRPVCYAFARAAGASGGEGAVLTVAHHPQERDQVAITATRPYPSGAAVEVTVDRTRLSFHTRGNSAFARDGRAAVAAFRRGRQAAARVAGRGTGAPEIFPLSGFGAAYDAISRACRG